MKDWEPNDLLIGDVVEVRSQTGSPGHERWEQKKIRELKMVHGQMCAMFDDWSYIGIGGDGIRFPWEDR